MEATGFSGTVVTASEGVRTHEMDEDGETVTDPREIGPAIDRAFASNVPYLVNVITDVDAAYPRNTFGI